MAYPTPAQIDAAVPVDGKPVHVIAVQNIPEAGTVSAVRFIIRGY